LSLSSGRSGAKRREVVCSCDELGGEASVEYMERREVEYLGIDSPAAVTDSLVRWANVLSRPALERLL
jgi:hypothetical protein